jgi:hypothetical protein
MRAKDLKTSTSNQGEAANARIALTADAEFTNADQPGIRMEIACP